MRADEFFGRVRASGGLTDRKEAKRWTLAVATALSHLLPNSEARRHFISQLPGVLKSHLLAEPPRSLLMDREALLQHLGAALGTHAPEAERALHVVYGVLREAVSAGEVAAFESQVPKDVAAMLERRP